MREPQKSSGVRLKWKEFPISFFVAASTWGSGCTSAAERMDARAQVAKHEAVPDKEAKSKPFKEKGK